MELRFTKMHGLGNDFVVVDATQRPFEPDASLLARLADRRFGVGCDQVLVLDPPPDKTVDFGYRIFNSDGSKSGQCGNGARCLARFIHQHRLSQRDSLRVRTATSVMELQLLSDGRVRVDMGAPQFEPAEIPLRVPARAARYSIEVAGMTVNFGAVSMGNPHAVLQVADVDAAQVEELGPKIQAQPVFPEGVNVGFLQVLDRKRACLRVYERGAGETLACGSGACAAMAVGRLWNLFDPIVEIQLRGGVLRLEWANNDGPVYMTGPAETVFEGTLQWPN